MAKDDGGTTTTEVPGVDASDEATNELAKRRQARAETGSNGTDPASIADRAAEGEAEEEDDGQVAFVLEQGKRVTLGSLYRRGCPIEYEFKLSGKAVKGGSNMGLIGFEDPDLTLVVPVRAGKVEVDPTYTPEGSVKKVTVRAHVKPTAVYDARTEAARAVLTGEAV